MAELNDARQREEKMHQFETGELRDILDNAQREHQEELMTLEQQNRAEAKLLQEGNATYDSLEEEHLRHKYEQTELTRDYHQTLEVLEETVVSLRDEIEFVRSKAQSEGRKVLVEKDSLISTPNHDSNLTN